jgi:hypothetical protein
MSKAYFIPPNVPGKRLWLGNFSGKLPKDGPNVGVTPAEIAQTTADNLYFGYVCDLHHQHTKTTQDWTAYKSALIRGSNLGDLPVTPDPGTPPPAVPAGIFTRASTLAARIKKHPNYNEAIGQDLGIIGSEQIIDYVNLKPVLTLVMKAGHPHILWIKQGMDGVEILVDRGDGKGFGFLAYATLGDFLDTAPLPAAGTSVVWKYKAIYREGDTQVGQWSDVASIAVLG